MVLKTYILSFKIKMILSDDSKEFGYDLWCFCKFSVLGMKILNVLIVFMR